MNGRAASIKARLVRRGPDEESFDRGFWAELDSSAKLERPGTWCSKPTSGGAETAPTLDFESPLAAFGTAKGRRQAATGDSHRTAAPICHLC